MMPGIKTIVALVFGLAIYTNSLFTRSAGSFADAEVSRQASLLVSANTRWRYHATSSLSLENWNNINFDDSNWKTGYSGFGYGDEDDRTRIDDMRGQADKVMIRTTFDIADPTMIEQLYFYIRYDDAFIAYLNGQEIARSTGLKTGLLDSIPSHEANDFELFTIADPQKFLQHNTNLLAVVGINHSIDSSDFSIEPVMAMSAINNPELAGTLTNQQWSADLDYLKLRLEDQSSYLLLNKFDYEQAINNLISKYKGSLTGLEFARLLEQYIARIGDAHANVNVNLDDLDDQYLPFVLADTSVGVVALTADQSRLIENDFPLLSSIDGFPLDRWLDVASSFVPQASSQLIRHQSFRQMRSIDRMRSELELPESNTVKFTLRSLDGLHKKNLTMKTSSKRLPSAKINSPKSAILDGNIGYLKIPSMYDKADDVVSLMHAFKQTRALIIDVRNNTGGRYDILRALYGFFIAEMSSPYVSNIAAYRLSDTFSEGHLHYRPTYRAYYPNWSTRELESIEKAKALFLPQWHLPHAEFSDWHFMLLGKSDEFKQFHYKQPVVVLSNPGSFSATDGFLSAFADLPQVTLIGQASSGGSGATQRFRLPNSGIEIAMSSMASFRPDGRLFDGHGIEVDIALMPEPSDFTGHSDAVLEKALTLLRKNPNR